MKHLLLALLLAALCATGYGQTIKTLGYNTSNNQVAFGPTNTNAPLTFTNTLRIGAGGIDFRPDGSLFFFDRDGDTDFFVFDNPDADAARARTNLGLGATWLTNDNVTNFRTAIELPLPALTNTSNVTMMRALAGSTNTNEPFSGTITFRDGNNDTRDMVISNGIILSVTEP